MTEGTQQTGSSDNAAVRPFRVGFPETELTDLRRRVNATRWPERETVTDDSQGVRLAMMQDLARAAWEQPQLFSEEVRASFRSLRK
jgi:hypothetical protein